MMFNNNAQLPKNSLDPFSKEIPLGQFSQVSPGSNFVHKNNAQVNGSFRFLRAGPKSLAFDPVAREYTQSLDNSMQTRMKQSAEEVERRQSQIRFNEKNRGGALPRVRAPGFTSDYHQATKFETSMFAEEYKWYWIGGVILLLLLFKSKL